MNGNIQKFLHRIYKIITSNFEGGYESEPVRKAIIINLFAIIGFAFMTYFGIQTLLSYKIWYSLILFGFALLTVFIFIYLRYSKNFIIAGHALVILLTLIEFFFIVSGGVEKIAFLWYYTYPILSLFILGLRKGSHYIAFLFSVTISLFIIQPDFFSVYNYNLILRFITSFTAVSIYYVKNGQKAIDFVNTNKADLIIMDIKMPVMNGLEATRVIKSSGKRIPIIALTAFSFEQDEKVSIDTGCDAFITKPLKKSNLIKLINEFL